MVDYIIYTDGAYSQLNKQGGCAFIILNGNKEVVYKNSHPFKNCTSNQMEMISCLLGLRAIKAQSNIQVISDSMYVIGTMTLGWKRKKNNILWSALDEAVQFHKSVEFQHVKGHNGDTYNEECDKMAVNASQLIDIK